MKLEIKTLKKFFDIKFLCILTMYKYLNRELVNSYFEIDSKFLNFFLEYSKTKDISVFDKFWGKCSVQKDIFIFCEELYENISAEKISSKEKFFKDLNKKLGNSLLKQVFPFYYKELYNYYLILYENQLEKNYQSYKDSNFRIYYFKNVTSIELCEIYYNNRDITFYIILDGLIKYKNQIFGDREVLFSNLPSIEKEFKIITPSCSIVLFIIKRNFLVQNSIEFKNNTFGTFKLYTLKIFETIFNLENVTSESYMKIFQIAMYLKERISHNKVLLLDVKYLSYKKEIIKIVEENIFLTEKEIVEKLLLKLDISISKMYKIFSKIFFTTPNKYIESIKISKTYYLLTNSDKKVEKISEQIGYSYKTFKEKFLARTGYLPTEFRNLMKGK